MKIYHVAKGRKERTCQRGCTIAVGEPSKNITPRYGPAKYYCSKHGPRPSEMSGGKMSEILAAQEALEDAVTAFENLEEDGCDLASAVEAAAEEGERIAEEYEESADNIEQYFSSSDTADECRERADNIREWVGELQGVDIEEFEADPQVGDDEEADEDDEPRNEKGETEEEWRERSAGEVSGISLNI